MIECARENRIMIPIFNDVIRIENLLNLQFERPQKVFFIRLVTRNLTINMSLVYLKSDSLMQISNQFRVTTQHKLSDWIYDGALKQHGTFATVPRKIRTERENQMSFLSNNRPFLMRHTTPSVSLWWQSQMILVQKTKKTKCE